MTDEPDAPTDREPSTRSLLDVLSLLDRLTTHAEAAGRTEAAAVLRAVRKAVARPGDRTTPR